MLELFRVEAENQTAILTNGLLELERGSAAQQCLETLMRAAHSLKGAARIVNLQVAVRVAHAMEDCFVAAQQGSLLLREAEIDVLFRGVDLIAHISKRSEATIAAWETDHAVEINQFLNSLEELMPIGKVSEALAGSLPAAPAASGSTGSPAKASPDEAASLPQTNGMTPGAEADRVLRLTAENLNRLLGLAGESLVESRWLRPFADSLQRLKRQHSDLEQTA